jgi:hypothetical protein
MNPSLIWPLGSLNQSNSNFIETSFLFYFKKKQNKFIRRSFKLMAEGAGSHGMELIRRF